MAAPAFHVHIKYLSFVAGWLVCWIDVPFKILLYRIGTGRYTAPGTLKVQVVEENCSSLRKVQTHGLNSRISDWIHSPRDFDTVEIQVAPAPGETRQST